MGANVQSQYWDLEPHTAAKHAILARYLDAWFPIISASSGRVLFLDAFAGRGRYGDGSPGSPIIALSRLLNHAFWSRMGNREFVFLFIEKDAENFEYLTQAVENFKIDWQRESGIKWPQNVTVLMLQGEFAEHAEGISQYLEFQKSHLAPTFALIDPFGWTGIDMETIARLLNHDKCEVFVNFMVNSVNRHLTNSQQANNMSRLFGLDVEAVLEGFDSGARVEHLRDVYMNQMKSVAGFPHVRWFAMQNRTGNIGYYLLHGCRNITAVEKMKDAMWKVSPTGDYQFSDRLAGVNVLFQATPDLEPLRAALLDRLGDGFPVAVQPTLQDWVIAETPYRKTHLTQVLRTLEKENPSPISVDRGQHRQFAPGVLIQLSP